MLYNQFLQHLEKNDPAPVYLFLEGSEPLMADAWKALLHKTVPPDARTFNGERLQAVDCDAEKVVGRMRTLPMFGSRQLLMVQNIEAWKQEQRQTLLAYLERPSPRACLVLTAGSRKGIEKVETAVAAHGLVVNFPALRGKEIPRWLQERAASRGKQLSPQAAYYLFEQVGEDPGCLERELEKLCLYVGDRPRIEMGDLEETVSAQRAYTAFELLGFVAENKPGMAVKSLRKLMLSGEAPLPVLSLLARQVRIMWQVKDGLERKWTVAEVAREVGIPPFVVKNHARQAAAFSEEDLRAAHGLIREADVKMKSTGTNPELILESVVLSLCLNKTPR